MEARSIKASGGRRTIKKYLFADLLVAGFAAPAVAEETKYFLVYDNQGLCSVLDGKPSEGKIAFEKAEGYSTKEEAKAALEVARNDPEKCKGVVE